MIEEVCNVTHAYQRQIGPDEDLVIELSYSMYYYYTYAIDWFV